MGPSGGEDKGPHTLNTPPPQISTCSPRQKHLSPVLLGCCGGCMCLGCDGCEGRLIIGLGC